MQPFLFGLLLSGGILIGYFLNPGKNILTFSTGNSKIEEILRIVGSNYVDTLNSDQIQEKTISELLKSLDPHSVYIPAVDLQAMNEPLEGEFEGIGVEFNILEDTIYVANVIPGGPSYDLGIQAGDRIIRVDNENTASINITNEKVMKLLKGKKGTQVTVNVLRQGYKDPIEYVIKRGKIPLYSVDAGVMLNSNTGYVKISRFAATTYDEMRSKLDKLRNSGMENLILDLRGNPGGYLSAAIQVADEFIPGRELLVYTEGRTQPRKNYKAGERGLFEQGKLVLLIDEGSASASEIVSGAIQDLDRGILVGRRSFGKGLVQEPFSLNDGSAIRLTVSRYYTPSGRCIQKSYTDGYDNYQFEVYNRFQHGEMDLQDSTRINDSLGFKTPAGRIVYGGGGIYPDVFVPVDTNYNRNLLSAIYRKSLHRIYIYHYLDENRSRLRAYKTGTDFSRDFKFTEPEWKAFQAYLTKQGIAGTLDTRTGNYLQNQMKALMARQLFDNDAFYLVLSSDDEFILKALESFKNYDQYLLPPIRK